MKPEYKEHKDICERCGQETKFMSRWYKTPSDYPIPQVVNPRSYLCQRCCQQLGWNASWFKKLVADEIKKQMGYEIRD